MSRVDTAEYWDARADGYAAGRRASKADRAVLAAAPPRGRVLEIGCGPGVFTALGLDAAREKVEWVATDVSPAFCEMVRSRVPAVQVICSDVRRLDLPADSFDVVYAMAVLHHLPQPELAGVFELVAKWLAPRGRFVLAEEWAFDPRDEAQRRLKRLRRRLSEHKGVEERHPTERDWEVALMFGGLLVDRCIWAIRPFDLEPYDALNDPRSVDDVAYLRARPDPLTVPMSLFCCRREPR